MKVLQGGNARFCAWVPQDIDAENGLRQQPTRPVHDPPHTYNYTHVFFFNMIII